MSSNEYYYRRMCATLEERVDKLEAENLKLIKRNALLEELKPAAKFYLRMTKHIKENENIRAAWKEFYTMYALMIPDINELK